MGEIEDYLEKENLHSSWIRNMFQMITMGIVLITFFREEKQLRKYIPIPISIILLGISIGIYSIYYTYYKNMLVLEQIYIIFLFIRIINTCERKLYDV